MTIKILEKERPVVFNMAVQIKFEELSGLPFEYKNLGTMGSMTKLIYAAMLIAGNVGFTYDEMLSKISSDEFKAASESMVEIMTAWYGIPAVINNEDSEDGDAKAEKKS